MAAYAHVLQGTPDQARYLEHNSRTWLSIDSGWSFISEQFISFVTSIRKGHESVRIPVIKAYTMVFDLCQQGCAYGQELYSRLEPMIISWLQDDVLPRYRYGPALSQFHKAHHEFVCVEKYLCCVFNYLNQFHVKREQCLTIEQLCLSCFHAIIFSEFKSGLSTAIETEISRFRSSCAANPTSYDGDIHLLRTVLNAVLNFRMLPGNPRSLYEEFLSGPVISGTERFYGGQYGEDLVSELGTSKYLNRMFVLLNNEISFFRQWLSKESTSLVTECLHTNLLIKPFPIMLADEDQGFNAMFNKRLVPELSLAFSLYQGHSTSIDMLASLFQEHVINSGRLLVNDLENFVANLISLRMSELQLIQAAFNNSIRFHRALHDAFEFILETTSNSAQLICSYLNKTLSNDGADLQISNLVALVCCLRQEKDIFSFHFRNALANRLLNSTGDHQGDKGFVEQLRTLLGRGFTHQMDVMISDILGNPVLVTQIGQVSFSARILTTGCWPASLVDCEKTMLVPSHIYPGLNALEALYKESTVGRRITWIHSAATCVIKARCFRSTPELHLSSIQAVILLLFNQRNSIVIKDLTALTGLSLPMIKRALRHMCTGKNNVLLKDPPQSYSVNDVLSVNFKFLASQRKIQISLGAEVAVADHELRQSIATIKEDRKHVIEACAVRLMKVKKSLLINELKAEVIGKLRQLFQVEEGMLTDIILDLVSREYLSRDAQNPDLIQYNPE